MKIMIARERSSIARSGFTQSYSFLSLRDYQTAWTFFRGLLDSVFQYSPFPFHDATDFSSGRTNL